MDRLTVVSTDSHIGTSYQQFRPYLEPAYRDRLDDLAEEDRVLRAGNEIVREMLRQGLSDVVDEGGVLAAGGYRETGDVQKRLAFLDAEGIAGEVLLVGQNGDGAPAFFHELNSPYPADVRAAGARAYHRWLADFVADSHGRLFAHAYAIPTSDVDELVEELRYVAERGFVSIEVPGFVPDATLPPLVSDVYDPFWAACAELGIAVVVHAGWGISQGHVTGLYGKLVAVKEATGEVPNLEQMREKFAMTPSPDETEDEAPDEVPDETKVKAEFDEAIMGPRRVLWQFMLSGVFDRHPTLKFALTEIRADWLPSSLAYLDDIVTERGLKLALKPSEYFARNCAITATAPRRYEVAMRHEIGVDRFLFGTDNPHLEGTWPNTAKWLGDAFQGVGEDDLRKILGENAIRFFDLDRGALDAAAARIGPTAAEISAGPAADEPFLAAWDRRSGYLKPAEEVERTSVEALANDVLDTVSAGGAARG